MNKELKKLKKLAEKHFYKNRTLTKQERFLLENSPFAGSIRADKRDYSFYKVLEQFGEVSDIPELAENNEKESPKKYRRQFVNSNVNRAYLSELIDDLEEEFGLGVFNRSLYKYEGVDFNRLKKFIDYHCKKNMIDKGYPATCSTLSMIMDASNDAYDLMYRLYALQR